MCVDCLSKVLIRQKAYLCTSVATWQGIGKKKGNCHPLILGRGKKFLKNVFLIEIFSSKNAKCALENRTSGEI